MRPRGMLVKWKAQIGMRGGVVAGVGGLAVRQCYAEHDRVLWRRSSSARLLFGVYAMILESRVASREQRRHGAVNAC
jgi:hypothetical protein